MGVWKSEKEFTWSVRKAAQQLGWLEYHTHRSQFSSAGFPDLCMVRGNRLIFAELKMPKGKVSESQQRWLDDLCVTPVEVYVWRPDDWDTILDILR